LTRQPRLYPSDNRLGAERLKEDEMRDEEFEVLEDGYVYLTREEFREKIDSLWFLNEEGEIERLPVRFEEE
jgi:hypothetical protein